MRVPPLQTSTESHFTKESSPDLPAWGSLVTLSTLRAEAPGHLLQVQMQPGTVAHAWSPSTLGGQGRQITLAQEFNTSQGGGAPRKAQEVKAEAYKSVFKNWFPSGAQQLMPVILALWEAEHRQMELIRWQAPFCPGPAQDSQYSSAPWTQNKVQTPESSMQALSCNWSPCLSLPPGWGRGPTAVSEPRAQYRIKD
ncbi:hypothetical protein AAY473_003066 [Plecturocebus cupreus]